MLVTASSHAAATTPATARAVAADAVHLLGTGLWIGALVPDLARADGPAARAGLDRLLLDRSDAGNVRLEFRRADVPDRAHAGDFGVEFIAGVHRTKEYIAYCQSGRRSAAAAFLFAQRGFKVWLLEGGLKALADQRLSDAERSLITGYADALGVSRSDLDALAQSVKEYLLSPLVKLANVETVAELGKKLGV